MVLTADDIAAITHIVTTTMASMPMQQQAAAAPHPEGARRAVDERFCRKINILSGIGWKDFSFQFKAATKSSHEVAFDLLCWAELEQSDIDAESYTTKRVSGELFNVLTTSLEGEPLQMLYNCNFNGLEALVKAVLANNTIKGDAAHATHHHSGKDERSQARAVPHRPVGVQDRGARERLRREIVRENEGSDPYFDAPRGVEGRHLAESRQV